MKLLTTFFFLILFTFTYSQIKVDADFEGGNIEVIKIIDSTNTIIFKPSLETEKNTTRCWFYFRIYNFDKTKPLNFHIKYEHKVMAPEYPVYSFNKKDWEKTQSEVNYYEKEKTVSKIFNEGDTLYFAAGFPYVYSDIINFTDEIAENKNIDTSTIVVSEGMRKVPKYLITEKNNLSKKDIIWIIGRQHAFETPTNYVLEGLVNYLISEDSLAVHLRKVAEIHIVPIMDVDNVAIGASGRMQKPIDLNRDWNPKSHWKVIQEVKKQILETSKNNNYRIFIDAHSTFPGATYPVFSYFNMYKNMEQDKNLVEFWDIFEKLEGFYANPIYEQKFKKGNIMADEYSSNIEIEKNKLPYFNSMDFSFTLECDWNIRPDNQQWTIENLRETGRNFGITICKYILKE